MAIESQSHSVAQSYSAADCAYEIHGKNGHTVTGAAAWRPSGTFSAVASCTCGWATSASFGHLTRAEALSHASQGAG